MFLKIYYSLDICVFFIFSFFIFIFFIFFICLLNERFISLIFLKFSDKVFGIEEEEIADFFDMNKITLQFFCFLCFFDFFILVVVYFLSNDFVFNSIGSAYSLNFISIIFLFILTCFFIFYFLMYIGWFQDLKKNFVCFFFRYQEFLIFIILHIVSFFLFNCKDWTSFFINVEILSFCFYIYTSLYGTMKPAVTFLKYSTNVRILEASLKYLIPGLFSSLLLIFGIFLIYFFVGSLSFDCLCVYLSQNNQFLFLYFWSKFFFFGFMCLLFSFCIKLNIVPFHSWVFWVYEGSLQHVVFFLSVIAKLFYFLVFFKYICFMIFYIKPLNTIFFFLGLLSIMFTSFFGLFEMRFNNLLAFSGILNMGYSFLALSLFTIQGFAIAFFSLLNYFIFSLFFYFYLVKNHVLVKGSFIKTINDFKVFTFFNLNIFFFFILIIFSIIGIPPLPGFYSKILLFLNFFLNKNIVCLVFLLLGVVISSFFYLRWIANLNLGVTLERMEGWDFKYLQTNFDCFWSFVILFFIFSLSFFFFIDNFLVMCSFIVSF